jgi:hypothetical protein
MPDLTYEDASMVFELPPGERGYGGGKIIPADPAMVAARMITKGQVITKEQAFKKEQPVKKEQAKRGKK